MGIFVWIDCQMHVSRLIVWAKTLD